MRQTMKRGSRLGHLNTGRLKMVDTKGNKTITGDMTANAFYGNGANLTGVNASFEIYNIENYSGGFSSQLGSAIEDANTNGGGVVYIPTGSYTMDATLDLKGIQDVVITGDGPSTQITTGDNRLSFGGAAGSVIALSSAISVGDTQVTVSDTTGISAGFEFQLERGPPRIVESVDSGTTMTMTERFRLAYPAGTSNDSSVYRTRSGHSKNITIQNLRINHNGNVNAIRASQMNNLVIKDCTFHCSSTVAHTVWINNMAEGYVRNCDFYGEASNLQRSIYFQDFMKGEVSGCTFQDLDYTTNGACVGAVYVEDLIIANNRMFATGASGAADFTNAITIAGYNWGAKILNNEISYTCTDSPAIRLQSAGNATGLANVIANNVIYQEAGNYAIWTSQQVRTAIIGNIIIGNTTDSLDYQDFTSCIILGNNFSDGLTSSGTNTGNVVQDNITS